MKKNIIILFLITLLLAFDSFAENIEADYCDPAIKAMITDVRDETIKNDSKIINEIIKEPVDTVAPTAKDANNPCFTYPDLNLEGLANAGITSFTDSMKNLISGLISQLAGAAEGLLGLADINPCQMFLDTVTDATKSAIPVEDFIDDTLRDYDPLDLMQSYIPSKSGSIINNQIIDYDSKDGIQLDPKGLNFDSIAADFLSQ